MFKGLIIQQIVLREDCFPPNYLTTHCGGVDPTGSTKTRLNGRTRWTPPQLTERMKRENFVCTPLQPPEPLY